MILEYKFRLLSLINIDNDELNDKQVYLVRSMLHFTQTKLKNLSFEP